MTRTTTAGRDGGGVGTVGRRRNHDHMRPSSAAADAAERVIRSTGASLFITAPVNLSRSLGLSLAARSPKHPSLNKTCNSAVKATVCARPAVPQNIRH
ncbi:MAG: hypothetical protein SNJ82_14650 [Gemmataceae bacterium]